MKGMRGRVSLARAARRASRPPPWRRRPERVPPAFARFDAMAAILQVSPSLENYACFVAAAMAFRRINGCPQHF